MSQPILTRALEQLIAAIQVRLEKKLNTPALLLLYSGIDIVGWLHADDPTNPVRNRFIEWVDTYLLQARPLQCTSLELYAARCGLVHSFSPDSGLTERGEARKIVYAWGTSNFRTLEEMIAVAKMGGYVAVQLETLVEAFALGVNQFLKELDLDPMESARVQKRAQKFFISLPEQDAQDLLRLAKDLLEPREA